MPRYAARVDNNHAKIVNRLKRVPGLSVTDTSRLGSGFPDIVVGFGGKNYLLEIKQPKKRDKLTPDEAKFQEAWRGQYDVVTSADEVIEIINKGVL